MDPRARKRGDPLFSSPVNMKRTCAAGTKIIGVALFLVIVALVPGCKEPVAPVEDPAAGVPAVDSMAAALAAINARIVREPATASHYVDRARHYALLDSTAKAITDMERAVQLDSNNAVNQLLLGDLYYRTVQVDKALTRFEKASSLEPLNTQALLKRAEIELVQRKHRQATRHVNDALKIDANVARGYYLKGFIHMEMGDTALAISSLRTAVEQDPFDYSSFTLLGKLSAAKHDPLAEQYYRTAIGLRPGQIEAWYNLGIYYQTHGKDSLALDAYRNIMAIDSNNALAWYNSGWVRMEHLNDPAQAERDFSKAIELEPTFANSWYNRGVLMERSGQLDSAAANYQMTILMEPDHDLAAEALDRLSDKGVRIKIREKKERKR